MAFDLIRWGRSIHELGISMSWLEIEAIVKHAPPGSAIREVADPISVYRTPESQLLSAAVDTLAGANWQRAGGKGPKPQPLMSRLKEQFDRERRHLSAPKSADALDAIRRKIAEKRKTAVDVDPRQLVLAQRGSSSGT